jgi:hypothetical protein
MSKVLAQFKNYIDIANNNKQNFNVYFFIKNYAFTKAYNVLSKEYSEVNESDRKLFEKMLEEYKQERTLAKYNHVMSKDEYITFLEQFFSHVDFDNANCYVLEVCKDLTEILSVFGEFEDLWKRRSI